MTVIGLTGPSGSGKTTFSEVASAHGIYVINADEVAHSVLRRTDAAKAIIKAFGDGVAEDGVPDRKKLAAAAFADPVSTEKLNRTVLPFIVKDIEGMIDNSPRDIVLIDAPTLFESGLDRRCDITVAVISDRCVSLKRIRERDGISEEAAEARLRAGNDESFFAERVDILIKNNGSLEDFKSECESVILKIPAGAEQTKNPR